MARMTDLMTPVATRARSLDFSALGLWLPNPDPILKSQGKDISIYRDLRADAHVGGCIRRRKSAVKALQWGLNRETAPARVHKAVAAMLDALDMDRLIGDCLDAAFYGYQPMEVIWERGDTLAPRVVRALPPEWFCFDAEGELRFRSRTAPVVGEELPTSKFLCPRQDASYVNPYGVADLAMVFWPMVFKKGGVRFWLSFTEKYGMPFLMGRAAPGASDDQQAELLDAVERMVADAVAVVPDGAAIDALEIRGGAANAELYERLVLWCRSEVSIALLGSNMATEMNSNRATAGAGLEVAEDLRDADAEIVAAAVNQLIDWFVKLNFGTAAAPRWSLWDQSAKDALRANRDRLLMETGARLTNAYWTREYGLDEGDLLPQGGDPNGDPNGEPLANPMANHGGTSGSPLPAAAHAATAPPAPTFPDQAALDALPDPDAAVLDAVLAPIVEALAAGHTAEELVGMIGEWYPRMDDTALAEMLARAMFVAELHGRFSAQAQRGHA